MEENVNIFQSENFINLKDSPEYQRTLVLFL